MTDPMSLEVEVTLTTGDIIHLLSLSDHMLKHKKDWPDETVKVHLVRVRHKLHEALGPFGDMIPIDTSDDGN